MTEMQPFELEKKPRKWILFAGVAIGAILIAAAVCIAVIFMQKHNNPVSQEQLDGVSYAVPAGWTRTDGDNAYYYYPEEDAMLYVTSSPNSGAEILASKSGKNGFLEGLMDDMENIRIASDEFKTFKGRKGFEVVFSAYYLDEYRDFKLVCMENKNGFIGFMMQTPSDSGYDFIPDYDAVINSIKVK